MHTSEVYDMREIVQIAVISTIFGLLLLFAGPASASGDMNTNLPVLCGGDVVDKMSADLGRLEGLGFDLTTIETAIASNDFQAAHSLMQEFMQEHKDELPPLHSGDIGDRMAARIDCLEEQGFDLTNIETAIANNDFQAAHSLMKEFMQEYQDELPAPPSDAKPVFDGGNAGSGRTV